MKETIYDLLNKYQITYNISEELTDTELGYLYLKMKSDIVNNCFDVLKEQYKRKDLFNANLKILFELAIDNKNKKYVIDEKQILQYLGKEKYSLNNNTYSNTIGIVNALSYTTIGGELLKIEINTYKGNGNIITTGLLGDVFKESVKIAFSYIKSNCDIDGFELEKIVLK